MRVLINFDSKTQTFKTRIDDMGSQKMVGYFDTRGEAEIKGEMRLQEMRKELKHKNKDSDFNELSAWNRRAKESHHRILVSYGLIAA